MAPKFFAEPWTLDFRIEDNLGQPDAVYETDETERLASVITPGHVESFVFELKYLGRTVFLMRTHPRGQEPFVEIRSLTGDEIADPNDFPLTRLINDANQAPKDTPTIDGAVLGHALAVARHSTRQASDAVALIERIVAARPNGG